MDKHNAKDYLPLVQALAEGKDIQFKLPNNPTGWAILDQPEFTRSPDCYRIKPKEFKNFALPWEYIGKEWNFATWSHISKVMVLYREQPKYVEGKGWFSINCIFATGLVTNEEGITEENGLARRVPE